MIDTIDTKSINRGVFEKIRAIIEPEFNALSIKTCEFGGIERIPSQSLDDFLNAILIKPTEIDQEKTSAQRLAKNDSTMWDIYIIKKWLGNIDDFGVIMKYAEVIGHLLDETAITPFVIGDYTVKPYNQEVVKYVCDNDAELFYRTNLADITGILLKFKIESLINKNS